MTEQTLELCPHADAHIIVRQVTGNAWETNEQTKVLAYIPFHKETETEYVTEPFEQCVLSVTDALRLVYQYTGSCIHIETRFTDTYCNA
jgi:hypothetical protein